MDGKGGHKCPAAGRNGCHDMATHRTREKMALKEEKNGVIKRN